MSLKALKTKRPVMIGGVAVVGICGVLITLYVLVPASGAWFFDQKTALVEAKTATFGFSLAGPTGSINGDTFTMAFDELSPGMGSNRMYILTNTGSRTGRVTLKTSDFHFNGGNNFDRNLFSLTVPDHGGAQLATDGASVDFGPVSPGESLWINLNAVLDSSAGNEWQGVTVSGTFKIGMDVY